MIGETLAHFKILSKLGEGGMGEVFLARDTQLGREVALKVLPQDMADDPDRLARFEREARAVAALNHPNIVTIHNIEEAGGRRLLVMEHIEGESLERLLPFEGFSLARVFEIAVPMAEALAAAHEKGITHRDLKPANVMITPDNHVKVLDFGLAKLATEVPGTPSPEVAGTPEDKNREEEATRTATLTGEGVVMGTAPYMSPEQLQGKPVDPRTDIFSLGVVLYEMVTGERPFRGESGIDLASKILRDTPSSVSEVKIGLPRHLGRIIQHCLEKNPRDRFQTALDVRNELRSLRKEVESGAYSATPASGITPTALPPSEVAGTPGTVGPYPPHEVPGTSTHSGSSPEVGGTPGSASSDLSSHPPSGAATVAPSPDLQQQAVRRPAWIPVVIAVAVLAAAGFWWFGREAADREQPTDASTDALAPKPSATPSVAVLPFADLSPEGDQEYFTDGLTVELINKLTRVGDLQVTGRTSAFKFKGQSEDLRSIGDQLGVSTVLEGSVRKAGDQLRISAQLVNVEDGFQLWSDTYDRTMRDIFQVQDEIAGAVAQALKVTLLGSSESPEESNLEAYNLFLQARYHLDRGTLDNLDKAGTLLERASELEPDSAEIWAEVGIVHMRRAFVAKTGAERDEALAQARQVLERSLELDPNLATAHSRMGWIEENQNVDFAAAEEHARKALELAPNDPITMGNAASLYSSLGRLDEAIDLHLEILEKDPLDLTNQMNIGWAYLAAGHLEEAAKVLETLIALEPDRYYVHSILGRVYLEQGRLNEAAEEYEQERDEESRLWGRIVVAHRRGETEASDQAFEQFLEEFADDNPATVASIYAYRGDTLRALDWLERALEEGDPDISSIKVQPTLKELHGEPRYVALLEKLGLAD